MDTVSALQEVYVVAAVRTPIGSFGGALSSLSAPQLGATAIRAALQQARVPASRVEELIMGNVISSNLGQAPARQAALLAELPPQVCCTLVNKVCASGLKAVALAAQAIMLGDRDVVVAGGMESMSNIPYYVPKARYGYQYGHGQLLDGLLRDGLEDAYSGKAMGCYGDATAKFMEIGREEQDAFAVRSYTLAAESTAAGLFKDELAPVSVPQRKGEPLMVAEDEEFRKVHFDKIPSLKPVFTSDGSVTAANASTINDGASALVLVSRKALKELNLKPLARIVSFADAERDPEWFTLAPVDAARKAAEKAGIPLQEIDLFEVNEAFSVVTLAFAKSLGLELDRINVRGGAVALGHPLGASGARILTTLTHALVQKRSRYGMAAICNGGGGATALLVERMD